MKWQYTNRNIIGQEMKDMMRGQPAGLTASI